MKKVNSLKTVFLLLTMLASFTSFSQLSESNVNNNKEWWNAIFSKLKMDLKDYEECEGGLFPYRIFINGIKEQKNDSIIFYKNGIIIVDEDDEFRIYKFRN